MALELRPVDDALAAAWDETLMHFPDWSVFQTEAWLKFIEEMQNARPVRLGVYEGGVLRGLWAAAEFHKAFFHILGSPMRGWMTAQMGPAGEGLDPAALLAAWRRFLLESRMDHAECCHPALVGDLAAPLGFEVIERQIYVCPIPSTEEAILAQFHRSCRYYARKALKGGVEVEITDHPAFVDHFYYQLEDVFGKQGVEPSCSKPLIAAFCRIMKPTGRLLTVWAKYEGKVIGTAINVIGNRTLHAFGWASLRSGQEHWPNEPIQLFSMKTAAERGCVRNELPGGGEYKAKYGAQREDRYEILYHRNVLSRVARQVYGGLRQWQLRRGARAAVMPPRPPLPVDHRFET